jgi:hypothetical protein
VLAARDCLVAGGHITVSATRVESEGVAERFPTRRLEARIAVEASGYGAAEAAASPKLADLVSRLGGELDLQHEPELRTTFIVSLPLVHRMVPADSSRPDERRRTPTPPRSRES